MKIAVPYADGNIFQHFGHAAQFKIYDVENGWIFSEQIIDSIGCGHGALAGLLGQQGIDVLICGGIGGGARFALMDAGIAIYGGVSGDADEAVELFLCNALNYDPNPRCSHHGEGHACGSHGCGSHSCH